MSDGWSVPRRTALKFAAAAPVAIGSAAGAEPAMREADVVVVGAGLAGLTAARELRRHKVKVSVVEARDRVGGRTLDHPLGGGHVAEGGGQWVGRTQTAIVGLAKELGVETFPAYAKGKTVVALGGARITVGERDESEDLRRAREALEAMAKEVPLANPWAAKKAAEWDKLTVGDWLKANAKRSETREEIGLEVETALGPPARTSLLWFLFYLRSAGGLRQLAAGAQELRLKGGPQSVSKKIAADLGEDLVLSSPVKKVEHGGGRVVVDSARVKVSAKRAVVAMSPADARRIEFDPALPAARAGLAKGWVGEPAFKANVVYPKPFWRDDGLSGLALADRGPVAVTFDNSPPDGSRGVIVAFLEPRRLPQEAAARRKAVVADLVALFGKAAAEPLDYFEMDWAAEKWTAGCVAPLPPGLLTEFGPALREPVGRLHWAGTETSEVWCGYMDGAVRSGRRVAEEVRKAL
jgi:monoamine oxidase